MEMNRNLTVLLDTLLCCPPHVTSGAVQPGPVLNRRSVGAGAGDGKYRATWIGRVALDGRGLDITNSWPDREFAGI